MYKTLVHLKLKNYAKVDNALLFIVLFFFITGKGLHYAKTGQKSDFLVDTCDVPAGTLWVTLDGPGRAAIDCSEVEDGYKVRYTPLVAGDYYISVKYNQYHIIGSPFKLQVEGKT